MRCVGVAHHSLRVCHTVCAVPYQVDIVVKDGQKPPEGVCYVNSVVMLLVVSSVRASGGWTCGAFWAPMHIALQVWSVVLCRPLLCRPLQVAAMFFAVHAQWRAPDLL